MTQASRNPDKIKYVSLVRGRWVYRPYIKNKERHKFAEIDRNGFIKPIKLGVEDDPWHRIVKAHASILELHANMGEREKWTLRWVVEQYEGSNEFDALAYKSRVQRKTFRRILDHDLSIEGVPATLGDLYLAEISLAMVKQIRDKRLRDLQKRGKSGMSHCNREISCMASAVQWARQQYDEVTNNPFRGLKALVEAKRTRYVTDIEYRTQYDQAVAMDYDYLPIVFELAYLLSCRGAEVCDLRIVDTEVVGSDGQRMVRVPRRKGSKTTHIAINERLGRAITSALSLHKKRDGRSSYLVPGARGGKLLKATADTAMQRLKRRMSDKRLVSFHEHKDEGKDATEKPLFWGLHDLKRKGISDATDSRIGGHKSASMREQYDTKLEVFEGPG